MEVKSKLELMKSDYVKFTFFYETEMILIT